MSDVLTLFESLLKQMRSAECPPSEVHACQAPTDHLLKGLVVVKVPS